MDPVVAGLVGFVPLAMLFVGLGFTKLPAHGVAVVSSTSAMAMAFVGWGLGSVSLGWAVFEGGLTALLPILWVVLAAVFVFLVGSETGGMDDIRHFLKGISPDPAIQAVLVAFCFGGFLEAVAGFGTAVAIPAAMLIALSFHPIKAMLICLVANWRATITLPH
jgi:lactate permease